MNSTDSSAADFLLVQGSDLEDAKSTGRILLMWHVLQTSRYSFG